MFDLATVFFALTLFFGGIATLFAGRHVTTSLLVLAVVALAFGSVETWFAWLLTILPRAAGRLGRGHARRL